MPAVNRRATCVPANRDASDRHRETECRGISGSDEIVGRRVRPFLQLSLVGVRIEPKGSHNVSPIQGHEEHAMEVIHCTMDISTVKYGVL